MNKKTFLQVVFTLALLFTMTSATDKSLFPFSGVIGDCKLGGSVCFNPTTNTYVLTGSGTNMWFKSDEYFMNWKQETGDFSLSAKVGFVGDGVDPHRKLGFIIRESLDPDSRYADISIHGDGLTSLQYRDKKGELTKEVKWSGKAPDHIVLERKGNKIIMKTAKGQMPQVVTGEIELPLPSSCYVGLFVCSHNPDVQETVYFTNVQLKK